MRNVLQIVEVQHWLVMRLVFRQISAILDQLELRCADVSTGLNFINCNGPFLMTNLIRYSGRILPSEVS